MHKTNGIKFIIEGFPDRAEEILRRFTDEEPFREICQDYFEAYQAYNYWRCMGGEVNTQIIEGYRSLVAALEEEIKEALN